MKKWGIPASAFYRYYLKMGEPYKDILDGNAKNVIASDSVATEGSIFLRLEKMKARFYALFSA